MVGDEFLEASRIVLSDDSVEAARKMRERADRAIKPE